MVHANQNHSREFSNRKILIVRASLFEILCPGPGRDKNNLRYWTSHIVKIMVYIHIMFGHLFDNSIKMVIRLLDYNLRELGKLKVFSHLQSDRKISQERTEILDIYPLLYRCWWLPLKIIYPADTQRAQRWNSVDSTLNRSCFNVVCLLGK